MINKTIYIFVRALYVVIDVIGVFAAVFLACFLRRAVLPVGLQEFFLDTLHPFYLVFISWLVAVLFFNSLNKLYETHREFVEHHEVAQVMKSIMWSVVLVLVFVYSIKIQGFPRSIFILMVGFTTAFLVMWRIVKRWCVDAMVANGYNNSNVLIVGAGKVGHMLVNEIERRPRLGFRIVGFLDDHKTTADLGGKYKVLGSLADMSTVIARKFVSKVFITVHPEGRVFHDMLEIAKEHNAAVRVVPQAFDKASGEFFKYNIGLVPVIEYYDVGHNRRQFGKRIFDLTVSFLGLILLAPVFIVIAILVKLDSSGPVFYAAKRYGCGGKIFKMWKFRSMVVGADKKRKELQSKNEVDGPIFKIKQDPRITHLGRFLRKYSFDELPQIFNVLAGQMSLVGPRPFIVAEVDHEDLKQLKRLQVRPGITGLWQVKGRNDLSFDQLIKWDTWYINNWSFTLDLEILFETIPVVLKGKGAY
jgi:exopolysaccharide biosynthesis polyprenyl glycosylphosphotransferase